jgi:hypothetical protein
MSNGKNVGTAIGAGAVIASIIGLANTQRAKAAESGGTVVPLSDESTFQLLTAIAQAEVENMTQLQNIANYTEKLSVNVSGYPENTITTISTRVQIAALNTPVQLPHIDIPDGMALQLKAWPTNGGMLMISDSRSGALDPNSAWPLIANEGIRYYVKNANVIYVSGNVVGDWLGITVEHRKGG